MTIDPQAMMKIQPELTSGENLQWAGMPNPRVIFHGDDWLLVPFSLLWGGFAIFWEALAMGHWGHATRNPNSAPIFLALWGIPFVVIGQYLIWGRFLYDGWLKKRTYYAVTNRRVVVVQDGWRRKMIAAYLEQIPSIEREGAPTGTLWLGAKLPLFGSRYKSSRGWSHFNVGNTPTFTDIDDTDYVYRLIADLREQAKKGNSGHF